MLAEQELEQEDTSVALDFLWLEITGKCNLQCTHCYAESLPIGTHGTLQPADWEQVISEAKQLGCRIVQFIGGEPTVHPHFLRLVRFAYELELEIEVFTNLVSISSRSWIVLKDCHVSIATSFYSANPEIHDRITERPGSFNKTVVNIKQALDRGFPLRTGLIKVLSEQDIEEAEALLRQMGVVNIGIDSVRSIGRGSMHAAPIERPEDALCGQCAVGKAAIDPDGWVYPCVFSRWHKIGNVRADNFTAIVTGQVMQSTRQQLETSFLSRATCSWQPAGCNPSDCNPMICSPRVCGPVGCQPNCSPRH